VMALDAIDRRLVVFQDTFDSVGMIRAKQFFLVKETDLFCTVGL